MNIKAAIVVSRRCLICFQVVKWVGLESLFGSTGFDKMVDKDFETEEIGAGEISPSGDAMGEG